MHSCEACPGSRALAVAAGRLGAYPLGAGDGSSSPSRSDLGSGPAPDLPGVLVGAYPDRQRVMMFVECGHGGLPVAGRCRQSCEVGVRVGTGGVGGGR
jgi:hypothetical protein